MKQPIEKKRQTKKDKEEKQKKDFQISPLYWKVEK